ncbi:flavodoxin family protein [Thalassolituus sp. LLYu03]|uniref:flavodoxin family protein n=1 Tax=Thalassolituus sp. LLYu03 TaxID=3421656 RepID=UPI003D284AA4
MPKTLLLIAHAPSPNTQALILACQRAVDACGCEQTQLLVKSCSETDAKAIQQADALLLLTPENLGYMSGAMKDVFDRIYYPCLEVTQGKAVAAIIRAGHDGTGTRRALESITSGLRWRWVQEPLILRGEWQDEYTEASATLAMAMAAALDSGII